MAVRRNGDGKGSDVRVVENSGEDRYEAFVHEELAGHILYRLQPGLITLLHTEVDPAFEGRGIGSRLVAAALDDIRSRELELVPLCPFVRGYIERHPEYANLVSAR